MTVCLHRSCSLRALTAKAQAKLTGHFDVSALSVIDAREAFHSLRR